MRRRVFVLFLASLAAIVCALPASGVELYHVDPAKEPAGFMGIEWGTPFEGLSEDMQLRESPNDITSIYVRPSDRLVIGDARVESIEYFFVEGAFASGRILGRGADNAASLLRQLGERYGGEPSFEEVQHAWWAVLVMIGYTYDRAADEVLVTVGHSPTLEKMRQAERAKPRSSEGPEIRLGADGFRDIAAGRSVHTIDGMTRVQVELGDFFERYTRQGDRLEVDGIPVESIVYLFFRHRFAGLEIRTSGERSTQALLAHAVELFGEPGGGSLDPGRYADPRGGREGRQKIVKPLDFGGTYVWRSPVGRGIGASFDDSGQSGLLRLTMRN